MKCNNLGNSIVFFLFNRVTNCANMGSGPSPDELAPFLEFVKNRLEAAEEMQDDYRMLETSFNDLHKRYEKARCVINESQLRDRQLQADLAIMRQAESVAEERVATLNRDYDNKCTELESKIAQLQENLESEEMKSNLKIGQMEIEVRQFQQQLQQKDTQINDLNRLLASAMSTGTTRRG